jgi:CRISPR-associated protein Csd2
MALEEEEFLNAPTGEEVEEEDVALQPGPGSDTNEEINRFVPESLRKLYDVYSYRHAAAILSSSCTTEFNELQEALTKFRITKNLIRRAGGNESEIPKLLSQALRPKAWLETRLTGNLLVTLESYQEIASNKANKKIAQKKVIERENFLDGHKVDFIKNDVAFDFEWNSKDQTFDRDLYAFRAFADCGLISAAVLVTRSAKLTPVFKKLGQGLTRDGKPDVDRKGNPKLVSSKYGASTTWMGKLLYRLNAGRSGACPVLALGIKPELISDWKKDE